MVDEHREYRPAESRDFARAVNNVDATDLRTTADDDARRTYGDEPEHAPEATYAGGRERMGGSTYDARTRDRVDAADVATAGAVAQPAPGVVDRDRRYVDRPEGATIEERRVVADDAPRPFSIAAGFFGWAVASFFTLVLATLVLALLGAAAYDATDAGATNLAQDTFNDLTTTGLVGLLVALFAAYLLGGYAAGRIGLWHGVGHGVAVVGWTILFTVLTVALGAWLGDAVLGLYVVPAIDWGDLTGPAIAGILVSLLAMLAGAILGAKLGTRPYGIDGAYEGRGARTYRRRGRPL